MIFSAGLLPGALALAVFLGVVGPVRPAAVLAVYLGAILIGLWGLF